MGPGDGSDPLRFGPAAAIGFEGIEAAGVARPLGAGGDDAVTGGGPVAVALGSEEAGGGGSWPGGYAS